MKKLICLLLLLLLTGCAGESVDLMPGAKPETSALGLYVYDGETITRRYLFESDAVRKEILKKFRNAKAIPTEVDVTTLQPPFYGLEMGGGELGEICGLWADGFFIRGDGAAYQFDYDFESLLADYPWETPDSFQSLTVMPCAGYVSKTEAGWNPNFLTPAKERTPLSGITMEVTDQTGDSLTVRYTNNTGGEWGYGYAFGLETQLDGVWYEVPAEQEMAFIEILRLLPDGGTADESYSLEPYGKLPSGTYRLTVQDDLSVEFILE